jgi:hypothetical protein
MRIAAATAALIANVETFISYSRFEEAPVDQSRLTRLVPLCATAPPVIRQFAARQSSLRLLSGDYSL